MMDVVNPVGAALAANSRGTPFAGRARSYRDLFALIAIAGNRSNT